ncbi:MAG: hypothetical protein AAGK23_10485 [Pseudomonadota bacterium]
MIGRLISSAVLAAWIVPASASAQQDLSGLYECQEEIITGDRLECYDRVVEALRSEALKASAQPPAPPTADPPSGATAPLSEAEPVAAATASPAPVVAAAPAPRRATEPNRLVRAVTAVTRDAAGKVLVELDNGQIWRQIDDVNLVRTLRRDTIEEAELRRTRFGAIWIKLDGGRAFKARRAN